jgi:hypothetical protein
LDWSTLVAVFEDLNLVRDLVLVSCINVLQSGGIARLDFNADIRLSVYK